MATLHLEPVTLPIREENGVHRIGRTRVSLDVVLRAFVEGQTPDQVLRNFDTLDMADLYLIFGYFMKHRSEAVDYLRECDEEWKEQRREWEASHPELIGLREQLMERARARSA
ncbi:MAG: DUF433 domain-containing protein [Gemmataceae bacterium]